VLGIAGILEKPMNEVIALAETKEMAPNTLPSPSLSAVSSFKKHKKSPPNPVSIPSQADRAKEATCPGCHIAFKVFTEGARGWNEKAWNAAGPIAVRNVTNASLHRARPRPQGSTPQKPSRSHK